MSTYAHRLGTLYQNFTSVNGVKGVTSYQKKKKTKKNHAGMVGTSFVYRLPAKRVQLTALIGKQLLASLLKLAM